MRKFLLLVTLSAALAFLVAPPHAAAASACSSKFPHGIRGTVRVNLLPQFHYTPAISMDQALYWSKKDFEDTVLADAAAHPDGPQIVFVDDVRAADLWNTLNLYGTGNVGDATDDGWSENAVSGMRQKGWLFETTSHRYTRQTTETPANDSVVESAHQFYQFIASGWTCGRGK